LITENNASLIQWRTIASNEGTIEGKMEQSPIPNRWDFSCFFNETDLNVSIFFMLSILPDDIKPSRSFHSGIKRLLNNGIKISERESI
jgi:hypothetical protein